MLQGYLTNILVKTNSYSNKLLNILVCLDCDYGNQTFIILI